MKLLILLAVVAVVAPHPYNHYDTKYDNFNIEQVAGNKRLLKAYAHCFIGDGKCTPEGNDIRGWIDEGSATACDKCTEKQKVLVAKFILALKEQCPEEWEVLRKRSDPENKQDEVLKNFLQKYGQ